MNAREALLGGTALIALGAGLLVPTAETRAQATQGTVTTQSGYRADAAQWFASMTSTNCTTTQTTVGNMTLTATPPAGQYVYLTGFRYTVSPNATASTSVAAWTSTNLTGSPAWLMSTTTAGANAPNNTYTVSETYPTGIKSTAPGTAVTLVPNATMASAYVCAQAWGYYNPQ